MKTGPTHGGPATNDDDTTIVASAPIIHSTATRRLGLHYRLYRRPRFSRELDRLLYGAPDPWEFSEPFRRLNIEGDFYADAELDRPMAVTR